MITFVYCCLCLLIVCGGSTEIDGTEYDNNNFPDTIPKKETLRYRAGSHIIMRCNSRHLHEDTNITWEFKHCNYMGYDCNDTNDSEWKKLDFNRHRKKLEIRNATEENIGLYRCLYNENSVIKSFSLDIVVTPKYTGPSPEVLSLVSSSDSFETLPNTPLVIKCKVTSVQPPVIRWLKESNEQSCKVKHQDHFYCSIPTSNDVYARPNNIYFSKLNVYGSHGDNNVTYVCFVVSVFGSDFKNITIKVQKPDTDTSEEAGKAFWWLFLIPLSLLLVPAGTWLCFYRRTTNRRRRFNEHQKQLIKPVVEIDNV